MKSPGSVLAILLALTACTSKPPNAHDPLVLSIKANQREAESAVVLLNPVTREPDCSATSVVIGDTPVLVTAAHCVSHRIDTFDTSEYAEKIAYTGDRIFFIPKRNWDSIMGSTCSASVVRYDPVHDRAILRPDDDNDMPEPLPIADLCENCINNDEKVHAISALYGWTEHVGEITGRSIYGGAAFWDSTMDILLGWSGSPVINNAGAQVGIVSRCFTEEYKTGKQCRTGRMLFTDVR